jgi:hypothetical protein
MVTGFIVLICIIILVGFFLEIAVPRGGPMIQPPPAGPPPDDPPSE